MNISFTLLLSILFWKRLSMLIITVYIPIETQQLFSLGVHSEKKKKIGLLIFEKSFRNLLDSFVKQVFKHCLRLQTLNTIECDDY